MPFEIVSRDSHAAAWRPADHVPPSADTIAPNTFYSAVVARHTVRVMQLLCDRWIRGEYGVRRTGTGEILATFPGGLP